MRAFLWNYFKRPNEQESLDKLSEFAVSESHPDLYRRFAEDGNPSSLSYERIAMLRSRVHETMALTSSGTRFVKAHNYLGAFGGHQLYNLEVTAGAIYIVRNPLDVAVSISHHFGLGIDESIDFMANEETAMPTNEIAVVEFLSSWSTHVSSWSSQAHPNVLVLRFEDMLAKPGKSFRSALKLVNQPDDPVRLKKAIKSSSFKRLRAWETRDGFAERSEHSGHFFRAGRKDQWRERLSRDQAMRIIEQHEEQMKRFGYIPRQLPGSI